MHRRSQKTKFEVIWSSEVRKRALESWRSGQIHTMFKLLQGISDFTGKILRIRITIYHRWWTLATLFDSYWCDKTILTTRTHPNWSVRCFGHIECFRFSANLRSKYKGTTGNGRVLAWSPTFEGSFSDLRCSNHLGFFSLAQYNYVYTNRIYRQNDPRNNTDR